MADQDWLAERFEANRSHLRGVAFRMLGSVAEADDAVQEAWIRLSRTDTSDVDNLRAWLTTVVGRVCLNMLRSRKTRREASLETHLPDPIVSPEAGHRSRAGSPAGRFGRARACSSSSTPWRPPNGSPSCCTTSSGCRSTRSHRSSAGRRRRRGSSRAVPVAASRVRPCPTSISTANGRSSTPSSRRRAAGDFERLLAVLDPDVVLRSDGGEARPELVSLVRGAQAVAEAGDDLPPLRRNGDAGPRERASRGASPGRPTGARSRSWP